MTDMNMRPIRRTKERNNTMMKQVTTTITLTLCALLLVQPVAAAWTTRSSTTSQTKEKSLEQLEVEVACARQPCFCPQGPAKTSHATIRAYEKMSLPGAQPSHDPAWQRVLACMRDEAQRTPVPDQHVCAGLGDFASAMAQARDEGLSWSFAASMVRNHPALQKVRPEHVTVLRDFHLKIVEDIYANPSVTPAQERAKIYSACKRVIP